MKTLRIEFEESDDWWEVALSVPLQTLFDIGDLVEDLKLAPGPFRTLYAAFLPFVTAWSYPEPVTVEGMLGRDYKEVLAVIGGWVDGVRSAPRPLLRASSAIAPSA
jgi:hypothetical protein